MNEELLERIKEELVMLSLLNQISVKNYQSGIGVHVFFNELSFFHVTDIKGNYLLYYRNGTSPILKTRDADIIFDQIKVWINKFLKIK